MSSRLQIPDGLRSVGNLYGASVQVASIGSGNPFAQEVVDGGKHGATGGITVHMIESLQIAKIAQTRMAIMPALHHNAHSKTCKLGSHTMIPVRKLIDAICVEGLDVVEVAMRAGW